MTEEWRPIAGYEGLYEVSDHGRVRRLRERRGGVDRPFPEPRIIRQNKSGKRGKHQYFVVRLYQGGVPKHFNAHKLVLLAFHGPRPPGHEAAHDDGNKDNNHYSNLLWKTHKDNIADKKRHGTERSGEDAPAAKLTTAQVIEIRGAVGASRVVARRYGVSHKTILKIRNGEWRRNG